MSILEPNIHCNRQNNDKINNNDDGRFRELIKPLQFIGVLEFPIGIVRLFFFLKYLYTILSITMKYSALKLVHMVHTMYSLCRIYWVWVKCGCHLTFKDICGWESNDGKRQQSNWTFQLKDYIFYYKKIVACVT